MAAPGQQREPRVQARQDLGPGDSKLASGKPTAYAVLRVTGSTGSGSLALSLRQLTQAQGYISQPPTTGEREALETGLETLGVSRAAYGRARP